ncbi:hypothetical protein [Mycobacterium sp. NPDC006124]|uniref:hypothetical protein n=1 Tax=Mycobacterium sp. NPDC006124 TaxID=3156729 RepID=UPI0033B841CF
MKNLFATTLVTGALAAAALGSANLAVAAVPTGPSNVTSTISGLEVKGFDVIVNRVGAAPLSACSIGAVRPGHEITRTDSGVPGDTLTTTVVSRTVYVDLAC